MNLRRKWKIEIFSMNRIWTAVSHNGGRRDRDEWRPWGQYRRRLQCSEENRSFTSAPHPERVKMKKLVCMLAVAAALAIAAAQSADDFRLPRDVWPLQYVLQITTSVCEENPDFSFHGLLNITVKVKQCTSIIKLNSKNLNISHNATALVPQNSNAVIPLISQIIDKENEFLILQFSENLCANCIYILHLKYDGILSNGLTGFYRSKYTDKRTSKTKRIAVTQFEPLDARMAFPCFDEPEFKALFKIGLGHSRACNALSNMPLISSKNIPDKPGWVMDEFDLTPRMSTYLVAWVLSEMECVNASAESRLRVCARGDALEQTEFARLIGAMSLQYFEKYFDLPYALPKVDMVAIPDFNFGAMENWGLITYRESALFFNEISSTLIAKQRIAGVVSHELAHQWFGNIVTLKWWSDLWLNEGFATYVENMGVQNAFPKWNSMNVEAGRQLLTVFEVDGLISSHAITSNIGHNRDVSQLFDAISYKKGSLLLRMANLFLGETVFRQGIRKYLKLFKYENADKEYLYDELTKSADKNWMLNNNLSLHTIFDSWTTQTGYPVVDVERHGDTLILSQKRFLFLQNTNEFSKDSSCWYFPITLTTQSIGDFNTTTPYAWMRCSELELTLPTAMKKDEWYIMNIQAAGIFRVNYDSENWELLSKTLNSECFTSVPAMNRMHIVNDVLNFAWTSDVEPELAFRIINYLTREHEYLPWLAAFSNFQKLKHIFMRTEDYDSFMHWVRYLLKPSFESIGTLDPDDLQGMRHQMLMTKWACDMQLDSCLSLSQKLFSQWQESRNYTHKYIDPIQLTSTVICMAVRNGGEEEWEYAWNFYKTIDDETMKVDILIALGCSGQVSILRRYLQMILEDDVIRKHDGSTVFLSVVGNKQGFNLAKDFLTTNMENVYKLYGPRNTQVANWIIGMANMMYSEAELEEFTNFTDANRQYLEGSEMAVNQSKEIIKINMYWYKRNYQQYVSLLSNQRNQI